MHFQLPPGLRPVDEAFHRRRLPILSFLGPAALRHPTSAYIDPGNFATETAGGSKFGYTAGLGDRRREPDGDADPDAVGEARHRHGQEPSGGLPRALLTTHLHAPLAAGRGRSRWRRISPSSSVRLSGFNLLLGTSLLPSRTFLTDNRRLSRSSASSASASDPFEAVIASPRRRDRRLLSRRALLLAPRPRCGCTQPVVPQLNQKPPAREIGNALRQSGIAHCAARDGFELIEELESRRQKCRG